MRDDGPHRILLADCVLNFRRDHMEAIWEEILRQGLRLRWSCYATPLTRCARPTTTA